MNTIQVQIVTYNSGDSIASCIQSVLSQTIPIDCCIVYDNHSTDDTVAIIEEQFPSVTVVRNAENLGYSKAHNQGFQRLTCDFVATLNPDVILEPDYLKEIVDAADHHPNVGAFTGKLLSPKTNTQGIPYIDTTGIVMKRNRRAFDRRQGQPDDRNSSDSPDVFGVSGAAAVYRRTMLDDVQLDMEYLDEDFFAYKEDVDLCWRARLMGWSCMYVQRAIGVHERGWKQGGRRKISPSIRMHSMKNRYLMMIKNDQPTLSDWLYILATECLVFGYGVFFEHQLFRSYGRVLKLSHKMIVKRKKMKEKILEKCGVKERINFQ